MADAKRSSGRVATRWGVLLLSVVASMPVSLGLAPPKKSQITPLDLKHARELLTSFDRAWAKGDSDQFTAAFSPSFGCNLYGYTDANMLREALKDLRTRWPKSKCTTHVLDLTAAGAVVQATVCRLIEGGRPDGEVEELCHLYYLRQTEDHDLQIIGLEEFSHQGLNRFKKREYRNEEAEFRFVVPAEMFLVPMQRVGFAIDRTILRSADLEYSIDCYVYRTRRPFELNHAFDHDLDTWKISTDAELQLRTDADIDGFPGIKAEVTYSGGGCLLNGRDEGNSNRTRIRWFAQLGSRYLFTIELDTPTARADDAKHDLDTLMSTLEFTPPSNAEYGETVDAHFGWSPAPSDQVTHPGSGLRLKAAKYQFEAWETNHQWVVNVYHEGNPTPCAWIDGYALLCDSIDLEEQIAGDNLEYNRHLAKSIEDKKCNVDERKGAPQTGTESRWIERRWVDRDGLEKVATTIYVAEAGYAFVIQGRRPSAEHAQLSADLEAIVHGMTFDRTPPKRSKKN